MLYGWKWSTLVFGSVVRPWKILQPTWITISAGWLFQGTHNHLALTSKAGFVTRSPEQDPCPEMQTALHLAWLQDMVTGLQGVMLGEVQDIHLVLLGFFSAVGRQCCFSQLSDSLVRRAYRSYKSELFQLIPLITIARIMDVHHFQLCFFFLPKPRTRRKAVHFKNKRSLLFLRIAPIRSLK